MAEVYFKKPVHAGEHCRHYSYIHASFADRSQGAQCGPQCARGLDLSGGTIRCMPIQPVSERCPEREGYTDEERAEWRAWVDASIARATLIMAQMPGSSTSRKSRSEWGKSGSFNCPGCNAGTVRWSRAPNNGHLRAACSTPHCFAVIQ